MQVLYFAQLWPKSQFSAAHVRSLGILERLIMRNFEVTFITPQKLSKESEVSMYDMVKKFQADPGNTEQMSNVLQKIKGPQIAIFDTFVTEERYSHYVHQMFPNCLHVVDLQDFHSLRLLRQKLVTQNKECSNVLQHWDVLRARPNFGYGVFEREIASLIRSDLCLTCSDYELPMINDILRINQNQTELVTFFYYTGKPKEKLGEEELELQKDFTRRRDFVFLGNMTHQPNYDSIQYLTSKLWPRIKAELPNAQLHIYGTNMQKGIQSDQNLGIRTMGVMKDISQLSKYLVHLAPIRFGAGIKGKIVDSWLYRLPVITTPIGAEGLFLESSKSIDYNILDKLKDSSFYSEMNVENLDNETLKLAQSQQEIINEYYKYEKRFDKLTFGGYYDNFTDEEFIQSAIKLYSQRDIWEEKSETGFKIVQMRMDKKVNEIMLERAFTRKQLTLNEDRQNSILRKVTWTETLRSNHHFAKFLNEKRRHQEYKRQQHKK